MNSFLIAIVAGLITWSMPASAAAAPQGSAHGRSSKALCKKIREAVSAGRTMEQITAEFDTDAEHVTKCMQTRSRPRARSKKAKSSASKRASPPQQKAPATSRSVRAAPSSSQPVRLRSATGRALP